MTIRLEGQFHRKCMTNQLKQVSQIQKEFIRNHVLGENAFENLPFD